jgi:putative nucleotidyltransferase with HDIG domain
MIENVSIKKLIMLTGDLPPMPYVARRVMDIVNNPSTNAHDLQEVISKDQGLTGQILKIANSALYACSRKIETLTDAIIMLGFNAIRSLSIMSATKNLYQFKRQGKVLGLKDKLLWEHSVGSAVAARMIAQKVSVGYVEQAFMGGLLHDIGKLVLLQKIPEVFDSIVEEVYNTGRHFNEVEQEVLGFTHAEVGALLIKKWKLPEDFEEAIRYHNEVTTGLNVENQLVYLIDLANHMCHKLGIGFLSEPDIVLAERCSALKLGISGENLERIQNSVRHVLREELNLFM